MGYVGVWWEYKNEQNRFIFGKHAHKRSELAAGSVSFGRSYRDLQLAHSREGDEQSLLERPSGPGVFKFNFDTGQVGMAGEGEAS